MLNKLRMMILLRAFSSYGRCIFPELLLREKRLTRDIFLLDTEQGDEVSIPKALEQDNLSLNFRFYDSTLSLIKE